MAARYFEKLCDKHNGQSFHVFYFYLKLPIPSKWDPEELSNRSDALELGWFKEGSIRVLFIKMWVLYRGTIKDTSGTKDFSAGTYKDVTTAWPEGRWESPYWDPESESFVEMVAFGWGSHPARGKLAGREIRKEIPWLLLIFSLIFWQRSSWAKPSGQ